MSVLPVLENNAGPCRGPKGQRGQVELHRLPYEVAVGTGLGFCATFRSEESGLYNAFGNLREEMQKCLGDVQGLNKSSAAQLPGQQKEGLLVPLGEQDWPIKHDTESPEG